MSVVLTFIIGSGASKVFLETESYELWVPKSSVAYTNYKHVNSNFLSGTRGVVILYTAKGEGNVLAQEPLSELLDLHHNMTLSPMYQDSCNKVDPILPCEYNNVLSVFNYDTNALDGAAAAGQLLPAIQALEDFVPLTTMLGGIEYVAKPGEERSDEPFEHPQGQPRGIIEHRGHRSMKCDSDDRRK